MNAIFLTTALLVTTGGPADYRDREPHPIAPSIPLLTKAEYGKIDTIIERFIQYDIGKLQGAEGKKALEDFNRLGPESIFNLVDGLNRAANMESSCPAVIIAKKVAGILTRTEDPQLLAFAKDSIGADVTAKRHLGVLQDLQFNILIRKAALQRRGITLGSPRPSRAMSIGELEKGIAKERGAALKSLLAEAEKRPGTKPIDLLVLGLANRDAEVVKLSQGLLAKNLQRQTGAALKGLLKHDRPEVRIAAAQTIGAKKLRYGAELIAQMQDADDDVRQAARRALVQISSGLDFGPAVDASFTEREAALTRWRAWWSRQQ